MASLTNVQKKVLSNTNTTAIARYTSIVSCIYLRDALQHSSSVAHSNDDATYTTHYFYGFFFCIGTMMVIAPKKNPISGMAKKRSHLIANS